MPQGGFHIVNIGAGTADNITLRGWQLLQRADLVIASESVRRQYATALAGKEVVDGGHGLFTDLALRRASADEVAAKEAEIRARIEGAHAAGKTIVLLESGDAALFSPYRGYQTAFRHLRPVLVPGVSSFNAANAALGQSLLHDQGQRLQLSGLAAFMTAKADATLPDIWVLFCMGLDLPQLITQARVLYPATTPVALILRAGYPDCEVIRLTVGGLEQIAGRAIAFPYCLIYIGIDPAPADHGIP